MKKGNLIFAGVMAILAAAVLAVSSGYPPARDGIPGPGFFPILISILLLISCGSLAITMLRLPKEEDKVILLLSPEHKRVYLTMLVLGLYVFLMPKIGFCVTSFLFLLGMIRWLGRYSWPVTLGASLGVVGLVYMVFSIVLKVSLDFGLLM